MNLKTAAALAVLGFSAAAAWADDEPADRQANDGATSNQPADSSAANAEQVEWQYVNGQSANSQPDGDSAVAAGEEQDQSANDDTAASDEAGGDQSAEAAQADHDDQYMAALPPDRDLSVSNESLRDQMQDKLVIILPKGWEGSVSKLIAALEDTSNDSEIVVLRREEQALNSDDAEDDDDPDDE